MKKTNRILLVVVSVILIFIFVACDSSTNNNQNEEINNTDNEVANNSGNVSENNTNNEDDIIDEIFNGEIIDISYMAPGVITVEQEDNNRYIQNVILDKFGINISLSPVSGQDKEAIDTLVAANSLPDCGWVYSGVNASTPLTYYNGGATRSVPIETVQKFAPDYYSIIQRDQSIHELQLAEDGENYFTFYGYREGNMNLGWTVIVRLDWMNNLSIEPKGDLVRLDDNVTITDGYYSISDFTDLIYDFTFSDPDMNGENDTIGHSIYSNKIYDFPYIPTLCAAFDIRRYYSPMENGWGIQSEISPGAKEAYIQLSKWIDLKVVNADPAGISLSGWITRWETGKYGSMACFYRYFGRDTNPPSNLINSDSNVQILVIPPLTDDEGNGGRAIGYEDFLVAPSLGFFYVNSAVVDEEKLNRIIQFFNWTSANYEGWMMCSIGEEGLHYSYDEKTNVKILLSEEEMEALPPEQRLLVGFGAPVTPTAPESYEVRQVIESARSRISLLQEYTTENWKPTSHVHIVTPPASELDLSIDWYARENKQAKVKAINDFIKIVYEGRSDIDTQWDNLMNTLDELGMQEYLLDLNSHSWVYDEFMKGNKVTPIEFYSDN